MKSIFRLSPPDNQVFIEIFQGLYREAQEKKQQTQRRTYAKILKSLKRYPIPIRNSTQALVLDGVGRCNADLFNNAQKTASKNSYADEEQHRKNLVQAMIQFASVVDNTSEKIDSESSVSNSTDSPSELQDSRKRCGIRLVPGTSGWSLLLCLYIFSNQFEKQEMQQSDINEAALLVQKYDRRCKISTWKAAITLVNDGLIKERLAPLPLSCKSRKSNCKTRSYYQLTEKGIAAGEHLLCSLDVPLTNIWSSTMNTLETCEKNKQINNKIVNTNNQLISNLSQSNLFGLSLRERLFKRLQRTQCSNTIDVACEQNSISQLPSNDSLPKQNISLDHFFLQPTPSPARNNTSCIDSESTNNFKNSDLIISPIVNTKTIQDIPVLPLVEDEKIQYNCTPIISPEHAQQQNIDYIDEVLLLNLLEQSSQSIIPLNVFDICLLIDYREVLSKANYQESHTPAQSYNEENKVCPPTSGSSQRYPYKIPLMDIIKQKLIFFETAPLPIGDFTWVCRFRKPKNIIFSNGLRELVSTTLGTKNVLLDGYVKDIDFVLPYIIERKTIPDLVASIMDGRFEDQKFRLLRSPGIQCIIFIIEGSEEELHHYASSKMKYTQGGLRTPIIPHSITESAIRNAIASTRILSGFSIIFSESLSHTAELLTHLNDKITTNFKKLFAECDNDLLKTAVKKDLPGNRCLRYLIANCPLRSFWEKRSRKLTTTLDVFGRQLRSVQSLGERGVEYLLCRYTTPAQLSLALRTYASNTAFLHDQDSGMHGRQPLTTKTLTVLRELYAPDTVANSLVRPEKVKIKRKSSEQKNVKSRISKLKGYKLQIDDKKQKTCEENLSTC